MIILENRQVENRIICPIELEYTDDDHDKPKRVTDRYIDISYASKESPAKVLSNLFPYQFDYFGEQVNSIEAAIQSLKYDDEAIRKICYGYSDLASVHLKGMIPYEWQKSGLLYTPKKVIDRFSEEYQEFLDELYVMALANPLYCFNLEHSGHKMLDHTIGENDQHRSTLTRTEYISRLYALRYFLQNDLARKEDPRQILRKVRKELD